MTATDELRKLLDERGVEWSDASDDDIKHTTWNTARCWFSEFNDGWTGWGMSMGGTPEQAIAATLGTPEIVWCKDCKHYDAYNSCCNKFVIDCYLATPQVNEKPGHEYTYGDYGYCAWGERREQ